MNLSRSADLVLDFCGHDAAEYAVKHWHYSQCMPQGPYVRVGVWEREKFKGVVLFSRGAAKDLLRRYSLSTTEGCELTRVALTDHTAPVSRIVSIAVKLLKKANPGLRLIVSFADPQRDHHGGIYQAMGWTYTGTTATSPEWVDPKTGRHYHARVVSKSGFVIQFGKVTRAKSADGLVQIEAPGKHRYLLPLDDAMREQITPLARPYPKRGRGAENGTAATSRRGRCDSDPSAPPDNGAA